MEECIALNSSIEKEEFADFRTLADLPLLEYAPISKSSKTKSHRLLIKSTDPHVTIHRMGRVCH